MRNLCLFTDSLEPSGLGEHMLTLASKLSDSYRVSFVCRPSSLVQRASDAGFPVYEIPNERDQLWQLLVNLKPDVFHGHAGIGWECHDGIRAAHAVGIPLVIRTEHLPYLLTDWQQIEEYKACFAQLDGVICVSRSVRRSYEEAGFPPHKLKVVQNGIRLRRHVANRAAVLESIGLPADARLVLAVGRLTEQKGYTYLLDAVPEIISRHPNTHVVIVGQGQQEHELRTRIAGLGVGDHTHLLTSGADIPALMSACDLFVSASLFEGLPLVVLEAMAMGKPVVGTQVCGTGEVIVDGRTGRLVEARRPDSLAQAVCAVLNDPARSAEWGRQGAQLVRSHFNAERMADETAAIYNALLADKAERRYYHYGQVSAAQPAT